MISSGCTLNYCLSVSVEKFCISSSLWQINPCHRTNAIIIWFSIRLKQTEWDLSRFSVLSIDHQSLCHYHQILIICTYTMSLLYFWLNCRESHVACVFLKQQIGPNFHDRSAWYKAKGAYALRSSPNPLLLVLRWENTRPPGAFSTNAHFL